MRVVAQDESISDQSSRPAQQSEPTAQSVSASQPASVPTNPGIADVESEGATSQPSKRIGKNAAIIIAVLGAAAAGFAVVFFLLTRPASGLALVDAFPDVVLRTAVERFDLDGDGVLTVDELSSVTWLDVEGATIVAGVDVFPELSGMHLSGKELEEVDVSACPVLETLEVFEAPALTTVAADDCPVLAAVTVANAPSLNSVSLTGSPTIDRVDLSDTSVAVVDLPEDAAPSIVVVPPNAQVNNLPSNKLTAHYLVTGFEEHKTTRTSPASSYEVTTTLQAEYDDEGRMTRWDLTTGTTPAVSGALTDYTAVFGYDSEGRMSEMKSMGIGPTGTMRWGYAYEKDGLSYKAKAEETTYDRHYGWSYDGQGRPASSEFCYARHEMLAVGTTNVTYDEEGHPTLSLNSVRPLLDGGGTSSEEIRASYDSLGRLELLDYADVGTGSSRGRITYRYDEAGRRIAREYDYAGVNGSLDTGSVLSYEDTYAFDEKGHLASGKSLMRRGSAAQATELRYSFETDTAGNVTHARLESSTGSMGGTVVAHDYAVEYRLVYLPTGMGRSNAVDLTNPFEPHVDVFPWYVRYQGSMYDEMEFLVANQEWLAAQAAGVEAPAETAPSSSQSDANAVVNDAGTSASEGQASGAENTSPDEQAQDAGTSLDAIFPRPFVFTSGAGGWATLMDVAADGSFSGSFSDTNMGERGEDYPNGTRYQTNFVGSFSGMTQVGEREYLLDLGSLEITNTEGETIEDGVRVVYLTGHVYGLGEPSTGEAGSFAAYAPGTSLSALPDSYQVIAKWAADDSGVLDRWVIISLRGGDNSIPWVERVN